MAEKDKTENEETYSTVVEEHNLKIALNKLKARGEMLEKMDKDKLIPNKMAFDIIDIAIMTDFINQVGASLGIDGKRIAELHQLLVNMQLEAATTPQEGEEDEGEDDSEFAEENRPQPDNEFMDPSVH